MPCYLFTYHAYGSWMPDRDRGFVRRGEGVLPPDPARAAQYRRDANETEAVFDDDVQGLLIEEVQTAAEKQAFRLHYIATQATHIHVLVSWKDDLEWAKLRNGIKQSFSRRLNRDVRSRTWFGDGASRKRVVNQEHFDHLVNHYLPSHSGSKWCEENGE